MILFLILVALPLMDWPLFLMDLVLLVEALATPWWTTPRCCRISLKSRDAVLILIALQFLTMESASKKWQVLCNLAFNREMLAFQRRFALWRNSWHWAVPRRHQSAVT